MKTLNEIDIELSDIFKSYDNIVNELTFETIGTFTTEDFQKKSDLLKDLDYQGIYLIEIKNRTNLNTFDEWILEFQKIWVEHKEFTPSIKKKRISVHSSLTSNLNEWIPLYIGKSKKINKRVEKHIFKEINKTTYALKLKARGNLDKETFRLKTIKLDVTNYDSILPIIERILRDQINPIIGKQ